eukprot:CAMPEP_0174704734 /NCGR_PEP_ID=MMETSP1094-20130205/8219_1 /TAXON_ID=156173 /ORGANISM="Chrysochromulina brevifilum, Strain UTEX LB 985" /LENGTH=170 /DNA_ID=CAMNT_0015902819 /DNA_START=114 /DNA_END=624 /DNA_ORIENTATION=+
MPRRIIPGPADDPGEAPWYPHERLALLFHGTAPTMVRLAHVRAIRAALGAQHAPPEELGNRTEAIWRVGERLEEVVVIAGELLLLLLVIGDALALRLADEALLVVVAEAGDVEGVHAEEVYRWQLEGCMTRGALGILEDLVHAVDLGDLGLHAPIILLKANRLARVLGNG